MSLNIVLENEHGNKLEEVDDKHNTLLTLTRMKDVTTTYCLQFIDPYGDTIFNYLQMEPLLDELGSLHSLTMNLEQRELVSNIEKLARRCRQERHLYLKFYGD